MPGFLRLSAAPDDRYRSRISRDAVDVRRLRIRRDARDCDLVWDTGGPPGLHGIEIHFLNDGLLGAELFINGLALVRKNKVVFIVAG